MATGLRKIRVAFIKHDGLSSGGTESFLRVAASNLPKDRFAVDFYYSEYDEKNKAAKEQLISSGVNTIKFNIKKIDYSSYTRDWIGTDFWKHFDESNYDLIQTGRAGHPEYPFCKMTEVPIVDSLHLSGMVDNQYNIARVMHICNWNADKWITAGGDKKRVEIISHPIDIKYDASKKQKDAFVYGFHQRKSDDIFSLVPLSSYAQIENEATQFSLLGGGDAYKKQAESLGIRNAKFIDHSSNKGKIYDFLNNLDVYAHGRRDGEVNSTAMAEAMFFGLPIVSHISDINNGHIECIGEAGKVVASVDEYSAELLKLREDGAYYKFRSAKSKERFNEKYKLEDQMANIIRIYGEVLENPFPNKIRRLYLHAVNYFTKRLIINRYTYKYIHGLNMKIKGWQGKF